MLETFLHVNDLKESCFEMLKELEIETCEDLLIAKADEDEWEALEDESALGKVLCGKLSQAMKEDLY